MPAYFALQRRSDCNHSAREVVRLKPASVSPIRHNNLKINLRGGGICAVSERSLDLFGHPFLNLAVTVFLFSLVLNGEVSTGLLACFLCLCALREPYTNSEDLLDFAVSTSPLLVFVDAVWLNNTNQCGARSR